MISISEDILIDQKDKSYFEIIRLHLDLIILSIIGLILIGILIATIWRASYRFILSFLGNITFIGLIFIGSYLLSNKIFNLERINRILRKRSGTTSYFVKYNRKLEKKGKIITVIGKISIFLIFLGILEMFFLYNLIFIHESSHTLMTIFTGNDPQGIYINVDYGGMSFSGTGGTPLERAFVVIAGSLGGVIFGFFGISYAVKKRVPIELFIPLFLILGKEVLFEIDYWIRGISNKGSDAWVLSHSMGIITPDVLRIFTTSAYYIAIVLLSMILVYKIIKDLNRYLDKVFPDFSPFM